MNTNTAIALDDSPDRSERNHTSEQIGVLSVAERSLSHLSDDDLLASTRHLVGRSNQIFAALLVHLAEVEARGLHRLRACSSLYIYCVYELRLSEDAAFRRVSAARLVKRFPALLGAIERGELHLTGLLMLGPHLTPENHLEVLAHAKHRTKKEIAKLVRLLDPLPDVPPRIAPLRPAPARVMPTATADVDSSGADSSDADTCAAGSVDGADSRDAANSVPAAARVAPPLAGPQRYQVQFTASEEYVNLVERAQALLSHAVPNAGLEELHLRAMRALVAELEKRKCATKVVKTVKAVKEAPPANAPEEPNEVTPPARPDPNTAAHHQHPRQRGRAIPAAVQRAVWIRDDARCSYVDSTTGQRCRETHHLELHHEAAFAHGGQHSLSNLTLRCTAHNTLAAEADFGREFIAQRKDASRHESYLRQSTSDST